MITKALALLLAWFIAATVTGYLCGVSLILNALLAGNGSYILWPLVALTLGYDKSLDMASVL